MYYFPSLALKIPFDLTHPLSVNDVDLSIKNQKHETRCVMKITEPNMNRVCLIEYPNFIALEKLENFENFKTLKSLNNLKILSNL